MNVGTKSLLIGVHQFIWHPITVLLAWIELYGLPNWKELVCIIIHDLGYYGCSNMDGPEGEKHPEYAAYLAWKYLDEKQDIYDAFSILSTQIPKGPVKNSLWYLCLFHSRHYARSKNTEPSKLCWADKLSIKYDPWWFYLPRAWLSGELFEYRKLHASMGEDFKTHRDWYNWAAGRAIQMGKQQNSGNISFHPQQEVR